MMASRWKQRQPSPAASTRDMSGPRETVRSKYSCSSSSVRLRLVKPMMEHISFTPDQAEWIFFSKRFFRPSPGMAVGYSPPKQAVQKPSSEPVSSRAWSRLR